jgi:branched-chain amino acid transport system substrate-binding protein
MKEWSSFMDKYCPERDKDDSSAVFGYAAAETLTQVLRQCGDDLSRTNIMRQAASLVNFHSSVLLPGIPINTSATDFRPIEQMRLVQFDGRTWMPLGRVLDTAFVGYTTTRVMSKPRAVKARCAAQSRAPTSSRRTDPARARAW